MRKPFVVAAAIAVASTLLPGTIRESRAAGSWTNADFKGTYVGVLTGFQYRIDNTGQAFASEPLSLVVRLMPDGSGTIQVDPDLGFFNIYDTMHYTVLPTGYLNAVGSTGGSFMIRGILSDRGKRLDAIGGNGGWSPAAGGLWGTATGALPPP